MGKFTVILNNGNSIFVEAEEAKMEITMGGLLLNDSEGKTVARFWNIQGCISPKKQICATGEPCPPPGNVKAVYLINDDGSLKELPIDRVIIERK